MEEILALHGASKVHVALDDLEAGRTNRRATPDHRSVVPGCVKNAGTSSDPLAKLRSLEPGKQR